MSSVQKTPPQRTLAQLIKTRAAAEVIKRWVEIPGTVASVQGSTVTVNFDVPGLTLPAATMPVAGSPYVLCPIKVGDPGVARAASVGSGTGATALQPNLATLTWYPQRSDAISQTTTTLTDATGATKVAIASSGVSVTGSLSTSAALSAGNGASGTFTSQDGKTVTVVSGIVTSIV